MANILGFRCDWTDGGQAALVPLMDGDSLADRIAVFERARYEDAVAAAARLIETG